VVEGISEQTSFGVLSNRNSIMKKIPINFHTKIMLPGVDKTAWVVFESILKIDQIFLAFYQPGHIFYLTVEDIDCCVSAKILETRSGFDMNGEHEEDGESHVSISAQGTLDERLQTRGGCREFVDALIKQYGKHKVSGAILF